MPEMKWISVEERLPEVGDEILFSLKKTGVVFAQVHFGVYVAHDVSGGYDPIPYDMRLQAWETSDRYFSRTEVTHWMPLPPPPEA